MLDVRLNAYAFEASGLTSIDRSPYCRSSMNERYIKWHTPWLSRDFEMLAFGNGGGLPLILFPPSFGRYYQNKDFGAVGSVAPSIDSGTVTVYCPDATDLDSLSNRGIHPAAPM